MAGEFNIMATPISIEATSADGRYFDIESYANGTLEVSVAGHYDRDDNRTPSTSMTFTAEEAPAVIVALQAWIEQL